jgi:3-deoxy-manno-octulosonate cytidylyltransferase (CMP-KDO synthetase)
MSIRVLGVIPSRFASSRFPGKAIHTIAGRTLVEHVYRRSLRADVLDEVVVATDDERVAEAVRGFGGNVEMTSAEHRCGTERVAEVASRHECEIVVNIQGDEPLIRPEMIQRAVHALIQDSTASMSTLSVPVEDWDQISDSNVVKVVTDLAGYAIYFSRCPIPFVRRDGAMPDHHASHAKHVGLYVYRKDYLLEFVQRSPTPLELSERLEQLRALETGARIRVVQTSWDSIGVDTPEDALRVERILRDGQELENGSARD